MKRIKLKAVLASRKAVLLGAAVAVVGLSLLGGTAAHAAVGTQPGHLTFSPATGTSTTVPTWNTDEACPAGLPFASLDLVYSDSTTAAPDINGIGATSVGATGPISGALLLNNTPLASFLSKALPAFGGYKAGQTAEAVVLCSSGTGGTGTTQYFQDEFITLTAAGGYTTSSTPPAGPVTPNVVLSVSPNPAQVNTQVTLSATVTAVVPPATTAAPVTTGTVQFESGTTASPTLIGTPVTVNASGVASTTTTFTTASTGLPIFAVYTSANTATIANANSNTVSEVLTTAAPNTELITVTVGATGAFTLTVPTGATDALTVAGSTATGTIAPVTVTDTRNTFPGWSVTGQATAFTGPTTPVVGTIPAANLNWTPTTTTPGDFTLGSPSTTGLGTAQTLASAAAGHGNTGTTTGFSLGAGLSLAIPASAPAGAYQSTLTLTGNPTAP